MPPQQPVTPVVINYNYGSPPPVRLWTKPARAPAGSKRITTEPSHYLIAFKDHTIYAATAYWVDGDTLHYFTAGNVHNQASLALVDRDFTERLNKEAGLDVKLPAPSK
jgi:endonuclease YncB( thermonuclease family)